VQLANARYEQSQALMSQSHAKLALVEQTNEALMKQFDLVKDEAGEIAGSDSFFAVAAH
jgi:hypothetical protein